MLEFSTMVLRNLIAFTPLVLVACSVSHPIGFERLVETGVPTAIPATPGKMFGCAPWSYDLPEGRKAVVEDLTGGGVLDDSFSFRVSAGTASLGCEVGLSEAKLTCLNRGGGGFQLGTGACATMGGLSFLASPGCWSGVLNEGTTRYNFDFAYVEELNAPVERVTWHEAETGRVVQAYEGIIDMQLRLYRDPTIQLEPSHADLLTASAVGLHFWRHTQYCD